MEVYIYIEIRQEWQATELTTDQPVLFGLCSLGSM